MSDRALAELELESFLGLLDEDLIVEGEMLPSAAIGKWKHLAFVSQPKPKATTSLPPIARAWITPDFCLVSECLSLDAGRGLCAKHCESLSPDEGAFVLLVLVFRKLARGARRDAFEAWLSAEKESIRAAWCARDAAAELAELLDTDRSWRAA